MAVYAYARVSTDRQAEEGLSLDAQQRQIAGYCQMVGIQVDAVFVEKGVSGSKPLGVRPEGAKLVTQLQPGDTIIAAKLDRLFRSALDALTMIESFKKRQISVHLLDLGGDVLGNGLGKLFLTVAAAFAEAERDRVRERVLDIKRDQRQQGRYLGGIVPFGYQVGERGALIEDAGQQHLIRCMVALRDGGASLRCIQAEAAAVGHKLSVEGIRGILTAARQRKPVQSI